MPSALDRGRRQEACWMCIGRTSIHFLVGGNTFIRFTVIQQGVYNTVKFIHYSMRALFIKSVIITSGIQATRRYTKTSMKWPVKRTRIWYWVVLGKSDLVYGGTHWHYISIVSSLPHIVQKWIWCSRDTILPRWCHFKSVYKWRHSTAFFPIPIKFKTGNQVFCTPSSS